MKPRKDEKFDVVDFVMRYEAGELEQDDVVEGFQYLIDSGMIAGLQGSYGAMAHRLIEAGLCHPAQKGAMAQWT